jgi:hypothetical protein
MRMTSCWESLHLHLLVSNNMEVAENTMLMMDAISLIIKSNHCIYPPGVSKLSGLDRLPNLFWVSNVMDCTTS